MAWKVPAVTDRCTPSRARRGLELTRGLAGERDREHVRGIDRALVRLPRDAMGEDAGLARARAREDREGLGGARDRVALGLVETGEQLAPCAHVSVIACTVPKGYDGYVPRSAETDRKRGRERGRKRGRKRGRPRVVIAASQLRAPRALPSAIRRSLGSLRCLLAPPRRTTPAAPRRPSPGCPEGWSDRGHRLPHGAGVVPLRSVTVPAPPLLSSRGCLCGAPPAPGRARRSQHRTDPRTEFKGKFRPRRGGAPRETPPAARAAVSSPAWRTPRT